MHPMHRQRAQWRSLWPEGSLDRPQGVDPGAQLSLAWTNFPMFTVGLVQRGFSDEDIAKIMGGNCMRVARDAWQSRVP
jgi:membrane dipeptidase